jgi:colanic acid/amylovoran biosynthesis glycosyltransferase
VGTIANPDVSEPATKIGYVVPEFPGQTHIFFWREVVALREAGTEVTLLSTRRPPDDACRHAFAAEARKETHYVFPPRIVRSIVALLRRPIRSIRAASYALGLRESPLKRRLRILALLPCAAEMLEVSRERGLSHIHVHSCADAAHLAAMCRLLGGPTYSLTLHGDLAVYGTDHASKMRHAKCVTAVTAALRRQIVDQVGLPPERVPVIWMGVDTRRFNPPAQRDGEPGRLHVLTVARLNVNKGHRYALAAIRRVVDEGIDIRYTIVGEGPDRAQIESEVKRLNLQDRVTLTGTQSEDAILELLRRVDAFILPSVGQGEAAPVSVMEAMACGLPVICSIIGGTPDMITTGVDGILTPQAGENEIADALRLLAGNVAERTRLATAARQAAGSDRLR